MTLVLRSVKGAKLTFAEMDGNLTHLNKPQENVTIVNELADLPTAVADVITLESDKTYIFTTHIDLLGSRIATVGINNIFGLSSENCSITSTGLGVGVAMISSDYTLVMENITLKNVDTAVSIDGTSRVVALDWENLNFENVPNVGTINNSANFIYENGAFLGAENMKFAGTIGTVSLSNSLFVGLGNLNPIINISATAIITRRFRTIFSSFVSIADNTAIEVDVLATIPNESYILNYVNFSGVGAYIGGIDETSNKALFTNCVGITNTAVNGQMYMADNATATTIAQTNTFVKVAGTTTASAENSKYAHTNNRLTNEASISRKYQIQCVLSFTAGNNNVCEFGFFDSKENGIRVPSRTKSTANSSGRAESVSFSCVVQHVDTNYIEIWCSNKTATTNITVTDMNVLVIEIK